MIEGMLEHAWCPKLGHAWVTDTVAYQKRVLHDSGVCKRTSYEGRENGKRRFLMLEINNKYDTQKRRSFIAYCKEKLGESKFKERNFSTDPEINNTIYHYYSPCGSHGKYIIQIDIIDFEYKNKLFALGFQYQNETYKFNCLRPGKYYDSSEPNDICDFKPIFTRNKYIYRMNLPKTKGYISLSKKERYIEKMSDKDFSEKLFIQFNNAIKLAEKLKPEFENIGCNIYS
jgi:hypothetical protein